MTLNTAAAGATLASFIDGEACPSSREDRTSVINPSDGTVCCFIPKGSAEDVDHAVRSSRHAFQSGCWSETPPSVRKKTLHGWADLIEANALELNLIDAREMGKPTSVSYASAASAARLVRFCAESVDKMTGEIYCSDRSTFVGQRRVPRGVVAGVTPWNFPTFNAALKAAPALAGGNCVILKPSELSPRAAILLAQLAVEAGLPPGVLNVSLGLGETAGKALGLHSDIDMISFTGSSAVGKLMLQYAGQSNMKIVVAECGGKSPQIVFDDGLDLDAVGDAVARSLLTNQGQICSVGSRLLAQRSLVPDLVPRIKARFADIVIGAATSPETTFRPLASAAQCARVMHYIQSARDDGARLEIGGRRVLTDSGGNFVDPTLFLDVPPQARIAQEEIFGPVLSVIPFGDEAEAIRIANGTVYGLIAYVWTSDLSRAMRLVKQIRSSVLVNAVAPAGEGAGHAFSNEPAGESGFGVEGGMAGIESYMRRQSLMVSHA